jgi:hypothetical protein
MSSANNNGNINLSNKLPCSFPKLQRQISIQHIRTSNDGSGRFSIIREVMKFNNRNYEMFGTNGDEKDVGSIEISSSCHPLLFEVVKPRMSSKNKKNQLVEQFIEYEKVVLKGPSGNKEIYPRKSFVYDYLVNTHK